MHQQLIYTPGFDPDTLKKLSKETSTYSPYISKLRKRKTSKKEGFIYLEKQDLTEKQDLLRKTGFLLHKSRISI